MLVKGATEGFLQKMPSNPNLTSFTKSKFVPKFVKSIYHYQDLIRSEGELDTSNFRLLFSCVLQKMHGKPQIQPVSINPHFTKIRKINRWWTKSNHFWRWSGYTHIHIEIRFLSALPDVSMPNFRLFLPCVLQKRSPNPKFDTFHGVGSIRLNWTLALHASLFCRWMPARPQILTSIFTQSDHIFLGLPHLLV